MPESASAVSQITEEEHSCGKQMKGAERRRNCGETKRELGEKAARCKVFQHGWCQELVEDGSWRQCLRGFEIMQPRQWPVRTWNMMEVSNGDTGTSKKKTSWLVGFCSSKLLFRKCWLLTWGISLLAKDQKAIHGDKKSLIKGSGRLWPRLQQTGFVGIVRIQPSLQSYFWTLQTLQSIALYTLSL